MDALLVTVEEAACTLAVSRRTIYRLLAMSELEAVHIGASCRITVSSLHRYVQRLIRASRLETIGGGS